ncbi:hypothetical protein [Flavobacterium sp.]|jgi:hypothetical protein|uniref:hypothetical protein n=1 Tax=Flavobacterium sp. TaxID=239 RepID=UPI0037BF3459
MNFKNVIIGIMCLIGAYIYFKYFNQSLFDDKKKQKSKDDGLSNSLIENVSLANDVRDFKGKIGGYGLIIIGLLMILIEIKRFFKL